MKTVIKGFIIHQQYTWAPTATITFTTHDYVTSPIDGTYQKTSVICAHEFEVETPDDFDPRPQQVAALQAAKQKVRAEFAARITEIEKQISELTCIDADFAAHRAELEVVVQAGTGRARRPQKDACVAKRTPCCQTAPPSSPTSPS